MAAESIDDDGSTETSAAISEQRQLIDLERQIRLGLQLFGVLLVLSATVIGVSYLGFTLADIVRQLDEWAHFVSAFLAPNFVDLIAYTQNNNIGGLRAIWVTFIHPGQIIASIVNAPVGSGSVIIPAALTTLIIGFTGTVLGFPFALLFGVLGSERVTPYPFNFIFRGTMSSIRAVPALVWVLIFIPLNGLGPMTATLAVGTDTIGNMGRLFTDELEEIDEGPIEAIRSTGANRPQTVIFGMLSQVKNSFIAWALYVLEINTRIAISLGVVSAGGLGMYIRLRLAHVTRSNYSRAAAGLVMVIVMVVMVELISSRIRARLRPGEHRRKSLTDVLVDLTAGSKWFGTDPTPVDVDSTDDGEDE